MIRFLPLPADRVLPGLILSDEAHLHLDQPHAVLCLFVLVLHQLWLFPTFVAFRLENQFNKSYRLRKVSFSLLKYSKKKDWLYNFSSQGVKKEK